MFDSPALVGAGYASALTLCVIAALSVAYWWHGRRARRNARAAPLKGRVLHAKLPEWVALSVPPQLAADLFKMGQAVVRECTCDEDALVVLSGNAPSSAWVHMGWHVGRQCDVLVESGGRRVAFTRSEVRSEWPASTLRLFDVAVVMFVLDDPSLYLDSIHMTRIQADVQAGVKELAVVRCYPLGGWKPQVPVDDMDALARVQFAESEVRAALAVDCVFPQEKSMHISVVVKGSCQLAFAVGRALRAWAAARVHPCNCAVYQLRGGQCVVGFDAVRDCAASQRYSS